MNRKGMGMMSFDEGHSHAQSNTNKALGSDVFT